MIKVIGSNTFAKYTRSITTSQSMSMKEIFDVLEVPLDYRRSIFAIKDGKAIQPFEEIQDGSEIHIFLVPEGG